MGCGVRRRIDRSAPLRRSASLLVLLCAATVGAQIPAARPTQADSATDRANRIVSPESPRAPLQSFLEPARRGSFSAAGTYLDVNGAIGCVLDRRRSAVSGG